MQGMVSKEKTARNKRRTLELRRRLLNALSIVQQARLWSVLDGESNEQQDMLQMYVDDDIQNGINFWKLLNHEKKCLFIH